MVWSYGVHRGVLHRLPPPGRRHRRSTITRRQIDGATPNRPRSNPEKRAPTRPRIVPIRTRMGPRSPLDRYQIDPDSTSSDHRVDPGSTRFDSDSMPDGPRRYVYSNAEPWAPTPGRTASCDVDQCHPHAVDKLGRSQPMSAKLVPNLAKVGQESAEFWLSSTDLGDVDQSRLKLARSRSRVARYRPKSGRDRPKLDRIRSRLPNKWP